MSLFEDIKFLIEDLLTRTTAFANSIFEFVGIPLDSDNFVFSALGKIVDFIGILTSLIGNLFDGVKQVLRITVDVSSSVGNYISFLPGVIQTSCAALLSLIVALCVVRWIT